MEQDGSYHLLSLLEFERLQPGHGSSLALPMGSISDAQAEKRNAEWGLCHGGTSHLRWALVVHSAHCSPCPSLLAAALLRSASPQLLPLEHPSLLLPFPLLQAVQMQLGLVSHTSSSALCPSCSGVLVLPDTPPEESHCDIKLSLHRQNSMGRWLTYQWIWEQTL